MLCLEIYGNTNMTYYGNNFKELYSNFIDVYKDYFQGDVSNKELFGSLLQETQKLGIYPLDKNDEISLLSFYNSVVKSPGIELTDKKWYEIIYCAVGSAYSIDEYGIDPKSSQFIICDEMDKNNSIEITNSSFDEDGKYIALQKGNERIQEKIKGR